MLLLEADKIEKKYVEGKSVVDVLKGASIRVEKGELLGIYGVSGSGKSTLLHILGGLDHANSGVVTFEGQRIDQMTENNLSDFRNKKIGFVFQFYYLLTEFSAVENVMMPCLISGKNKKEARSLAMAALKEVKMDHRAHHRPNMLSGGEQQRVAVARAVVMRPKLILADEPTGNLDRKTGEQVFEYLLQLNKRDNISMIIVSHNQELLNRFERTVLFRDGILHDI